MASCGDAGNDLSQCGLAGRGLVLRGVARRDWKQYGMTWNSVVWCYWNYLGMVGVSWPACDHDVAYNLTLETC